MLSLKRNEGTSFFIYPSRDADPSMTVAELFQNGPVEIVIGKHRGGQTLVKVDAPTELMIRRAELEERRQWPVPTGKQLSPNEMQNSTSTEIIEAIACLAGDEAETIRIWCEPTTQEIMAVWMSVTNDGVNPSADFCWGAMGNRWGDAVEVSTTIE